MAIRSTPEIAEPEAPQTQTQTQRSGGLFTRIQLRVKLAMRGDDEDLLLENTTPIAWKVYHDFHMLGIIDPRETRIFRVQKQGNFSVRPNTESDAVEYLVLPLDARVRRVEIYRRRLAQALEVYEMKAA